MPRKDPQARKEYARVHYAANPEKIGKVTRRWALKNPEKVREYSRRWRKENPERILAHNRKSRGLPEPTRPCPEMCECCGGPPNGIGCLNLDHCHETGIFRGWICNSCNRGLGLLGDNIDGLNNGIKYLGRVS